MKTYMPHAMTMSVTHPTFSWSTILQMCGWIAAETSGRGGVLRRENIRSWHATSIPGLTRSPRTKCWYLCLQREKRGRREGVMMGWEEKEDSLKHHVCVSD